MRTTDAIELFEYLYWARDTILRAAAELSDDEFTSTETVTNAVCGRPWSTSSTSSGAGASD